MKKIFFHWVCICILSCLFAPNIFAADINKADELFESGTFQAALDEYDQVAKDSKDTREAFKAFYRGCESLTYLYRYGEAVERARNYTGDLSGPDQYRFLTLKAELLRNFLLQYGSYQRDDVIDVAGKEAFSLTPKEIREEITKAYTQLWESRRDLVKRSLTEETYFLDLKGVDFGMYPTVLDYVAQSWFSHIVQTVYEETAEKKDPNPAAMPLLADVFERPLDVNDPQGLVAAELIEALIREHGTADTEARERWKIRRLLLPTQYSYLFAYSENKNYTDYALEARNVLSRWVDGFKDLEAKADALYQSAVLLHSWTSNDKVEHREQQARELCQRVEQEFPQSKMKPFAHRLRMEIEMPLLYLQPKPAAQPGQGSVVSSNEYLVITKNTKKVYFRLYPFDPDRAKQLNVEQENYGYRGYSGLFSSYPYPGWIKKIAETTVPFKDWQQNIKDDGDYANISTDVILPQLEKGLYVLLASGDRDFKFGNSLLNAAVVNVTDLVLMVTTGVTAKTESAYYRFVEDGGPDQAEDEVSRLYTVDAASGRPVQDVGISIFNFNTNEPSVRLKTGAQGDASFRIPVYLSQNVGTYAQFDALAYKDRSYAVLQQPLYFNHVSPSPYDVFIETDRPIYRPGDKLQLKVIAVRRTSSGMKIIDTKQSVSISARDTNGKDFFNKEVALNEFGSASTDFDVPTGRLLGQYSLTAEYRDGRFSGYSTVYFTVEEYKRPEFEMTFKDPETAWKYNEPVEILGNATYYFGGAVPNAPVSYRIRRQWYVPYCFRYWFGRNYSFDGGGSEIASGQVITDKDGRFTIAFTPTSSGSTPYYGQMPDISSYEVEVDGRDAGGRTIQASRSFRAGKNAMYYEITAQKGFFFANAPVKIDARQLTMNDAPLEGEANYEVYSLPADAVANAGYNYGNWQNVQILQVQLKDVVSGPMAASGRIVYNTDGEGTIELRSLKQGAYRLVMKAKDAWGEDVEQSQIFVVAKDVDTAVPIGAYSVTIPEQTEYVVGQTAKFLIGSALGAGNYFVEIWTGEYLQYKRLIESDRPVQLIEVPVTQTLKGGFTLRWFGVKNSQVNYGQESVAVPWNEKKLNVELDPFTAELMPGTDVTWGVKVSDRDQKPVVAEVLALMYDRSLEYYFSSSYPWLDSLYLQKFPQDYNYGLDSSRPMNIYQIPVTEGLLQKILKSFEQPLEDLRAPGLRTWQTWAKGGQRGNSEYFAMDSYSRSDIAKPMLASAPLEKKAGDKVLSYLGSDERSKSRIAQEISGGASVATRKAFADTAFFKPHILTTVDGRGSFTFRVPEQLTGWKVKAFAFTGDAKEGIVVKEAVTRKDLMARVDIPRFFREKDKGTITAFVHNEGKETLKGQLTIGVMENNESVNEKIKLSDATREFSVEPHSQQSFDWLIEIPPGVTTYTVRVQAVSGALSDAEERALPILPSRERLMESRFVALSGSITKKLEIKLGNDPTRINESMTLQVDPQLFLTVLNTIPFLVEYPFECVEQILNKYVPLSIMHQVYEKHPEVQRAVAKIPRRTTPSPAWEQDDPNRMMKLMETPWVWQSEGRPTIWPVIDLLQPETVKAKEEENLEKLRNAQLPNGAFPWWPGGRDDPYITLYVLEGFAQARRYGVDVPQDMIERALGYVNKEIPLRLKPEAYELSLISMAAYVVTSYSQQDFPAAREGFEAAKSWVTFLENNIHALTQFGKAYLAYTYMNLGDVKRANEVLDMALDGSREDPIAGVYWAPEKYSWVWYSDTLEMHAFLLRTLQELRPNDKRIDGMVQWILFNRKGTVWKSTKASVAAVYALLDYMNKKGSLVSDETFKVQWGTTTDSVTVAADDWLEKPLRWNKTGFEIIPADDTASVSKDGPGVAFASLNWMYSTDQIPQASEPGMLTLSRVFYLRVKEGEDYHLKPLPSGSTVHVGDQIEVQLKINTRSQFEYVHLKDPKAAGFEAETLLSGWKYDPLWFYEEPRDSLSNFFMQWVPHGEYILRYRLRPTKPGTYRIGAAVLQPMYAPEMSAHSDGFMINVEGK